MADLVERARKRAKWLRQRNCASSTYTNSVPDLLEELAARVEVLEEAHLDALEVLEAEDDQDVES